MDDHIIPSEIREKIIELGFFPVSFAPLYKLYSVVGLHGEDRYNIQLNQADLSVHSVHKLLYRWNITGTRILSVTRKLVASQ